jgi:hypothetical protein
MTSYSIEIGYNSTFKKEEVLPVLQSVVKHLQDKPYLIAEEVMRIEPNLSKERVLEYAESYQEPVQDLTIRWEESEVRMLASGAGESRDIKEALRRAFCRLVLEAMHREKMEINIHVG